MSAETGGPERGRGMSEIKGPVTVAPHSGGIAGTIHVMEGLRTVCSVGFGPARPFGKAMGLAQEIAAALNAHAQADADREELALLREHFDLAYSGVIQSVDAVNAHAARVREAAQRVRDWQAAHPERLEVRSDG